MARYLALVFASLALAAQDRPALQAALGQQLARDVRSRETVIENSMVRDYVTRVGQRIATGYTIEVIAGDPGLMHEPISLLGGQVFIPAALILEARDEAEFAGMLAHAMGHVASGHYQARKSANGTIPVVFAGGDLVPASLLPQHREFELRADWWAVSAMANAGWDPAALVRYVGRMQPAEDPRQKFSPLPERDLRLTNLIDAIRDVPGGRYSVSDEFPHIQEEIRAAMAVTRPREIPSLRKPQ